MDVSGGLSLVQTILQVLGSPFWMKIESVLGLESQLEKLTDTMSTIEAVLLDAEEQEQLQQYRLSYVEINRLRRLKEALYRADDLFDEIATLTHRKKLMPCNNKMSNEVSLFFSRSNQLRSAFTWSEEMEKIRELLDDIVKDHRHDFGLRPPVGLEAKRMRINARETYSFVSDKDVFIGRNEDKNTVIGMLLDTTVKEDVSVVTIVGIGGLGKTSLAQHVYADLERIQKEFPLKMWVCVSDDFDVKVLLRTILKSATDKTDHDKMEKLQNDHDKDKLEKLQKDLRQILDGKKYLLVLDDVWNEDSQKWQKLANLLAGGERASRILVTTRSKKVADVVGSCRIHELKGLSTEDSWGLFERMTVEPGQHLEPPLEGIGKEIVGKCANVPLAIRVVGSLLRGQDESRWRYVRDTDLANIKQDEISGIVPVLKISYYYLPFHLRSCFSYCAIFPKDYKIIKEDLIRLWMAQGFIMPSDGESFEDAGEEYFKQLLVRCFFQDVERDEVTGDISCKMHDLIHDVAEEVAGTEILSSTSNTRCFNAKTRHISIDRSTPKDIFDHFTMRIRMRSLLVLMSQGTYESLSRSLITRVLPKLKYVRVLALNGIQLKTLPSAIGQLLHLRYLDLSNNTKLSILPAYITKLHNLQTLKLRRCINLKRLPRDLRKLVNLRHLEIHRCFSLTHMPPGMSSMTSLYRLTRFVVRQRRKWGSAVGELKDLENFINHSATMEICFERGARYNNGGGGFLSKSERLRKIKYFWFSNDDDSEMNNEEALLQGLQPHPNLRKLKIWDYHGTGFPSWGDSSMNLQNCLPNLVSIELSRCTWLEQLPLMSQLRHLKVLRLYHLKKVEYVESSNISGDGAPTASGGSTQVEAEELTFFPCLKELTVGGMTKLKGWWKTPSLESGKDDTREGGFPSNSSYSFPQLSRLEIRWCPDLTIFPLCPKLEELELNRFNGALSPIMRLDGEGQGQGGLRAVDIDDVGYLNSLPIQSFHPLYCLNITFSDVGIGEVGEVFQSGRLSSLQSLAIICCHNLKSISGRGVWEHFTALETLKIEYCYRLQLDDLDELELEDEDDVNNSSNGCTREEGEIKYTYTPWRYLAPTLRSLTLGDLPEPVKLPKGIGALSSLQSLKIERCNNLEALPPTIGGLSSLRSLEVFWCKKFKSLPEEMCYLTSLQKLYIWGSDPELEKRCKGPAGADWPKIRHVPNILF